MSISVGLNLLLAAADSEADIDIRGRENLSRMALACNMALGALDDMAAGKELVHQVYMTSNDSVLKILEQENNNVSFL